jgi:hypothetical protein
VVSDAAVALDEAFHLVLLKLLALPLGWAAE